MVQGPHAVDWHEKVVSEEASWNDGIEEEEEGSTLCIPKIWLNWLTVMYSFTTSQYRHTEKQDTHSQSEKREKKVEKVKKLSGEKYWKVWQRAGRVSTSHGKAGATASERQWRAAGDEERGGIEEFPYIL